MLQVRALPLRAIATDLAQGRDSLPSVRPVSVPVQLKKLQVCEVGRNRWEKERRKEVEGRGRNWGEVAGSDIRGGATKWKGLESCLYEGHFIVKGFNPEHIGLCVSA